MVSSQENSLPMVSKFITILGSQLHYLEQGEGDPILFLHSIPVSSYIWRNVIPHLKGLGRCIAVDLIGMGKSDKPAIEYSIQDHINYINEFISKMNLTNITLVMHGWGSIIGLDYAMRNPNNCKALVFYEAYLKTMENEVAMPPYEEQIAFWSQSDNMDRLLQDGAFFVDKVLPQATLRKLSDEEFNVYRAPFKEKNTQKPLIQYLKELPKPSERSAVDPLINQYSAELQKSTLPKLLLYAMPGFITSIDTVMWAKKNLKNLEIMDIGEAFHYAQETNPTMMGEAISVWLQGL